VIQVAFDTPSEEARWALDVLLSVLGLRWTTVPPDAEADLVYGRPRTTARAAIWAGPQTGWDDPRPIVDHTRGAGIVRLPSDQGADAGQPGTVVLFDAVYAAYASLTAPWEAVDPTDEVGCPIAGMSWLARQGLLERPLVHEYAAALGAALQAAGISLPPPRKPSIVLTHDVDSNFGHLFARRESLSLLRRDLVALRPSALRRFAGLLRRLGGPYGSDPNDRWDDWFALAGARGGRPTYFVASYGLFDKGSLRHDPPYDARHPEVRSALRDLIAKGAELGIHFSLQAQASAEQVAAECERLASLIDAPVRSARHHWWAVGQPAETVLGWQARAGIRLDCSLGYNDLPGFRRGIAAPFHPFDRETRQPLTIWELPTVAMDLALYDGRRPPEESAELLQRLLDTTKAIGGALVIDWHAHALNPARLNGAGAGLRALLTSRTSEQVALCTPLEIVETLERAQ
jgi:hypothetical protein